MINSDVILKISKLINSPKEKDELICFAKLHSNNFIIKNASCGFNILSIAKSISKIASTYYGKGGAGILLTCSEDNTVLLLQRSANVEQPYTWGIPGGALSKDEDFYDFDKSTNNDLKSQFDNSDFIDTAFRESGEELFSDNSGYLDKTKMKLIGETEYKDNGFVYKTFIYDISLSEKKRITKSINLNWENDKAKWYSTNNLPSNLHFGVKFTKDELTKAKIPVFKEDKDELTWLRDIVYSIGDLISKENKNILDDMLLSIDNSIDKIKDFADKQFDFSKENKNAFDVNIDDIIKKQSIQILAFFDNCIKNLLSAGERKAASELFKERASFSKFKPEDYDHMGLVKKPRLDRQAHEGFLYHGTNLESAILILKSKALSDLTKRISLSSSLDSASEFGDIIFVFDAKRLQRMGAKKMNYYGEHNSSAVKNIEKFIKQRKDKNKDRTDVQRVSEDNYKYPWISESFIHENEWIIKSPFKFDDNSLVKIIISKRIYGDHYDKKVFSSPEESMEILSNLTNVPIEIKNQSSKDKSRGIPSKKVKFNNENFIKSSNVQELFHSCIIPQYHKIDEIILNIDYLVPGAFFILDTCTKLKSKIKRIREYTLKNDLDEFLKPELDSFFTDILNASLELKNAKNVVTWSDKFKKIINELLKCNEKFLEITNSYTKKERKEINLEDLLFNKAEENTLLKIFVYFTSIETKEISYKDAEEWCSNNIFDIYKDENTSKEINYNNIAKKIYNIINSYLKFFLKKYDENFNNYSIYQIDSFVKMNSDINVYKIESKLKLLYLKKEIKSKNSENYSEGKESTFDNNYDDKQDYDEKEDSFFGKNCKNYKDLKNKFSNKKQFWDFEEYIFSKVISKDNLNKFILKNWLLDDNDLNIVSDIISNIDLYDNAPPKLKEAIDELNSKISYEEIKKEDPIF